MLVLHRQPDRVQAALEVGARRGEAHVPGPGEGLPEAVAGPDVGLVAALGGPVRVLEDVGRAGDGEEAGTGWPWPCRLCRSCHRMFRPCLLGRGRGYTCKVTMAGMTQRGVCATHTARCAMCKTQLWLVLSYQFGGYAEQLVGPCQPPEQDPLAIGLSIGGARGRGG